MPEVYPESPQSLFIASKVVCNYNLMLQPMSKLNFTGMFYVIFMNTANVSKTEQNITSTEKKKNRRRNKY